jgi:hypothetical protein
MIFAGAYGYSRLTAGATVNVKSQSLGGFLCDTTGTITVTMTHGANNAKVLVEDLPVTAGQFYPMPIKVTAEGVRFVSTGAEGLIVG